MTNKEMSKYIGDLICKELECKNCPLYSINCDAGDTYSNLYKNLEFHYEQFKDKEIYDLFKKRLDKEIEEKMLKTRNEEIEYIHTNRVDFGENNLLRDDLVIREVVIAATDTYINLSLFYNDYEILYFKKLINEKVYINALNDLYLLALLHIDDEEYERIREELEDNA